MNFYREPKVIFSLSSEMEKSESLPIKKMELKKKLHDLEKLLISVKLLLSRFVHYRMSTWTLIGKFWKTHPKIFSKFQFSCS